MRRTKRVISLLCAGAMLLGMLSGCGSSQESAGNTGEDETIVIKVGHTAQTTEPYHLGLEAMQEKLDELTGGKVVLEIHANSELGGERDMLDQVQLGDIQMCIAPTAQLSNYDSNFKIFDLPYLFEDREHAYAVWDSEIGQEIASTLTEKNMRLLTYYEAGVRHLMTTDKAVTAMEDLKGMKIRTVENDIHMAAWSAFGANPTPMAYNELYTGLEQGTVEGAEAANTNYYSQAFYEVSGNWAMVSWLIMGCGLVVNEGWYAGLDEDIQTAIAEAAAYSAGVEREDYQQLDEECYQKLVDAGVNITEPDLIPFKEAAQTVWEEYADEVGGMDLIESIRAMAE